MTEPLSRRAQAPGVPLGWALGFGALMLAVLGFMIWAVMLVQDVRSLRGWVESNVAWLRGSRPPRR